MSKLEIGISVVLVVIGIIVYIKTKRRTESIQDQYIPTDDLKGTKFENEVLGLINLVRHDNGLGYLLKDDIASRYAYSRVKDLKKLSKITKKNCHENFNTSVLMDKGYNGVGENVAWQYNNPHDLVHAWINSPEHAENILKHNWKYVGLRAQKGKDGKLIIVNIFGS